MQSTFLVTHKTPPTGPFFQGYAFVGADYVAGETGAMEYSSTTGHALGSGYDGCYVSCWPENDCWRFGVDAPGYRKLFYYHDGNIWAVSDSFVRICNYLRACAVTLRPNYAQLAAITQRGGPALQQLPTHETSVHGIHLAPLGFDLCITEERAKLEKCPMRAREGTYESALSDYCELWVSRFETLLSDGRVDVSVDLSGGVDSRTTFSLYMAARSRLYEAGHSVHEARLKCHSIKGDKRDQEVASTLTEAFGLQLNAPYQIPNFTPTPSERYAKWRELCLGVYHPIYFPKQAASPWHVGFTGGGAEGYRRFSRGSAFRLERQDIENFTQKLSSMLRHPFLRPEFQDNLRNVIDRYEAPGVDPLIQYYREFRGRLHAGRTPAYAVSYAPLSGKSMDVVYNNGGRERVLTAQFNYDIIASTFPALLEFDFDSPEKAMDDTNLNSLSSLKLASTSSPGKVWVGSEESSEIPLEGDESRLSDLLSRDLELASQDPFVKKFCGSELIKDAHEIVRKFSRRGRFFHATDGVKISAVLTAHLVSPCAE